MTTPVALLVAVTAAWGIAASVGSLTVPWMPASPPVWAFRAAGVAARRSNTKMENPAQSAWRKLWANVFVLRFMFASIKEFRIVLLGAGPYLVLRSARIIVTLLHICQPEMLFLRPI
jgi:hypothetical protein